MSTPRTRTLRHLRRLVQAGALFQVAACGGKDSAVVCDPLPDPLQCRADMDPVEVQQATSVSATWAKSGDTFEIQVSVSMWDEHDQLAFSADPTATGGTVSGVTRETTTLTFTLTPDTGPTTAEVTIPVTCEDQPVTLTGSLDLTSPVDGGGVGWTWAT